MITRKEIIDYTVRMGCKRDLVQKGMVVSPSGDVFCIATLNGRYPNGIYYPNDQRSPKEAIYCGVNSIRARNGLDNTDSQARKNVAVTKTDGIDKFVYFFEKIGLQSNQYFFHGRYKYIGYEWVKQFDTRRKDDILFHLSFVDRPNIK